MNSLDTVLVVVLVISAALGLYSGVIRQLLSVAGLIAGIVLAHAMAVAAAFARRRSSTALPSAGSCCAGGSQRRQPVGHASRRSVGLLFLGWADRTIGGLGLFQRAGLHRHSHGCGTAASRGVSPAL
jgi:membrane protein required for colicin V production